MSNNTVKKGLNTKLEYHGMMLTAESIKNVIEDVHDSNMTTVKSGKGTKVPICIWGKHGIGKTSIPSQIAKENNMGYKSIAPAQFEEMGDLLGMPGTGVNLLLRDEDGKVIKEKLVDSDAVTSYINVGWERNMNKQNQMIMSPPQFVPNVDLGDPATGIFVIDDFNRAGKRIINGIMQLLQDGRLDSWALPEGWTIVLTANPSGGTYQITELDQAQMTRMLHVSMEFEEKLWAKWALKQELDERVINFVLANPETIRTGELTTPRSIEYFANTIKKYPDLKESLGMVNIMAEGVLDKTAAIQFVTFINNNLVHLISPTELLESKSVKNLIKTKVVDAFAKGNNYRIDILNVICTRVIYHCIDRLDGKLSKLQMTNIKEFLKTDGIPNDLRLDMAQQLVESGHKELKAIMSDPEIGMLLLKRM